MKEQKIIMQMEYKWRTLRVLRKILYCMLKFKAGYTSRGVCFISQCISNYYVDLVELQQKYEECTGHKIKYYKRYEI